jgi:polyisoprenoid-binding protein YceI
MKKIIQSLLLIIFFAFIQADSTPWKIHPEQSKIEFTIDGLLGSDVTGTFSGLSGEIIFDENNLAKSSIKTSIQVNSINTGNGKRDKHLRSSDYFEAEKYPTITFRSKRIIKIADGYKVSGDLTIKGTAKEIDIPFTFVSKENTGSFNGSFMVNRLDYGIGEESRLMGDEASIVLNIPVVK